MAKYTSKGAAILLSIASVFTAIAQCDSINAPDAKVETVDTTALDSSVGKEKAPTGYTDSGECSGSCFFDPAGTTHKAMTAFLAAPSTSSWKITYTDGVPTSWAFSAIVTKFTPKMAMGQFLKADFAMDVTGVVTGW
ncbi:MAG: hypothetical protein KGO96_12840 [Elusimicrobia bacterium]|nr:hypothetical protein [Elusimicrobiota bacterium]